MIAEHLYNKRFFGFIPIAVTKSVRELGRILEIYPHT